MKIYELVRSIRKQIGENPDIATLRTFRASLDSPAFPQQLLDERRSINDPAVLEAFDEALFELWREFGDRAAKLAHDRNMVVGGGLAGGAGLMIGGAAAMSVVVSAPAGFVMVVAGGVTIGIAYIHGLRLSRLERLYSDLDDRLAAICEKLQ